MKHPTGYAKPRRLAAPKPRRKVRLDLKRRPTPEPDDELGIQQKSHFWKWVGLVALLHLVVISLVYLIYENASTPKPPEQFISLLPDGDVVKGTPGAQEAHKLGPTTPAPAVHHTSAPPPPPVVAIQPPKPVLKTEAPTSPADKPITPPKPPPKVKVDLTLADAPTVDKPVTKPKPKPHHKKPVVKSTDDSEDHDQDTTANPDSAGLSKEQIAEKLGEKLDAPGVKDSEKTGASGSANSHQNKFSAYYLMIAQQIDDQWQIPNVAAGMTSNPLVHIYVEKDGRVPPESVYLMRSSGNSVYDESAVSTAKNFGYLREPLPDGCPPDISIDFKPDR
jgi:outer membrane biosynthesis protein TonB